MIAAAETTPGFKSASGLLVAYERARAQPSAWWTPRAAVNADLTAVAQAVWATLWPGELWPSGWTARWTSTLAPIELLSGHPETLLGICDRVERRMFLAHDAHERRRARWVATEGWTLVWPCPLYTLIHELLHLRGLDHEDESDDAVFHRIVTLALEELWSATEGRGAECPG